MRICRVCQKSENEIDFIRVGAICKPCNCEYMKQYHAKNREKSNARRKMAYKENRKSQEWVKKERIRSRDYWNNARHEAIMAYGGYSCSCCGEDEPLFLSIDHIDNNGSKHRKEIGNRGSGIYVWLRKNNYPDGFQILCMNCNHGKSRNNGICPHKSNTHNSVNSVELSEETIPSEAS